MNILGCLVPFLQCVAKQRVAIINPHVEGKESWRQPEFYTISGLLCFCNFCFSLLYLLPHKSVGPLGDIWTSVLGPSRTTLIQSLLLDWISLKINKSTVYLLLQENYCFIFLITLQSLFTRVTLNSFGQQLEHAIPLPCVITACDEVCVCLSGLV